MARTSKGEELVAAAAMFPMPAAAARPTAARIAAGSAKLPRGTLPSRSREPRVRLKLELWRPCRVSLDGCEDSLRARADDVRELLGEDRLPSGELIRSPVLGWVQQRRSNGEAGGAGLPEKRQPSIVEALTCSPGGCRGVTSTAAPPSWRGRGTPGMAIQIDVQFGGKVRSVARSASGPMSDGSQRLTAPVKGTAASASSATTPARHDDLLSAEVLDNACESGSSCSEASDYPG